MGLRIISSCFYAPGCRGFSFAPQWAERLYDLALWVSSVVMSREFPGLVWGVGCVGTKVPRYEGLAPVHDNKQGKQRNSYDDKDADSQCCRESDGECILEAVG